MSLLATICLQIFIFRWPKIFIIFVTNSWFRFSASSRYLWSQFKLFVCFSANTKCEMQSELKREGEMARGKSDRGWQTLSRPIRHIECRAARLINAGQSITLHTTLARSGSGSKNNKLIMQQCAKCEQKYYTRWALKLFVLWESFWLHKPAGIGICIARHLLWYEFQLFQPGGKQAEKKLYKI